MFGKIFVKYRSTKAFRYLLISLNIISVLFLVWAFINYKYLIQSLFDSLLAYVVAAMVLGLNLRFTAKLIRTSKAKGSTHRYAEEFYLGKSKPLHEKYYYGLENSVVKSALLTHHQLIFGASGSGKTFSTLRPQCYFDVKWGRRLFIIDPKGDIDFCNSVYSCASFFERSEQFFYFSITNPEKSHSFNPLIGITNNEVKDLLISCTEWNEPYYKKMAEMVLLDILANMERPTLSKIAAMIPDEKEFLGLKADLTIMCKSDYGRLIDSEDAPSIEDLHNDNKICFFSLNTQSYPEASVQLGRIILGSLMALSNKVQSQVEEKNRKETTIIVDEFGSFLTETFINFLNKARSSKFRLILATQSPGDVELDGDKTRKQIADSTTVKMFLRLSDAETTEYCSSVVGTHSVEKRTSRIDDRNFHSDTYTGSIREVEEFIVHPGTIKKFEVGEGVVYTQSPYSISHVKFDFHKHYNFPEVSYLESSLANSRKTAYENKKIIKKDEQSSATVEDFPTELIEEVL